MTTRKIAVFDVLGTSFGFDNMIATTEDLYGEPLKQAGISPTAFVMGWYYCAQRDFAFLSMMNSYTPIAQVFKAILPRQLLTAFESLSPTPELQPADLDKLMSCLKSMEPRNHLVECIQLLRQEGYECYAFTNGGKENTQGLYKQANKTGDGNFLGNLDTQVISCDEFKIAKPNTEVYEGVKKRILNGEKAEMVFFAAHSWDLAAAAKVGFKTAYVDFEEHDPAEAIFGKPTFYAQDLLELAEKVVAK